VTEVSVIVPTHNRCQLLELTLRSVFEQRNVAFEVIVVDDGSTDDTSRLLRSLADRVRVVRHERPGGVSAARNRGIAEARGRWVAFLDDDDLWAPDKLAYQLEALRHSDRRWAYAGAVEIMMNHRILAGQPPAPPERVVKELMVRNMLPAGSSNVIVLKDWLPAPPVFDGRFFHSADWDLWIRLARQGPPACVPKPLVAYRFHPGSASLDLPGMFAEADEIEKRHGASVDRSAFNRYLARLAKRAGWRRAALRHYSRAAAGDHRYLVREFVPDVYQLAADVAWSRASQLGIRRPAPRAARDPHRKWREEAQVWVDRLLLGERNTHAATITGNP
jgi:glycosyltransferase involved in cell wall biosynthesis